ncbi:spermidine/putrescine ABC transporter substrate-binding protein [Leuconostocaceae bacterium ESL0723]|nr:spermidine/putrescine ABC transporter substrate-binding protein [Leuconostocaceae bacterium ESL0723]
MENKRRWIYGGLFAVLLLVLIFCFSRSFKTNHQAKTLNIIGWSEFVPQSVLDNFTKQTGIRINYVSYSDPDQMLSKVLTSANGTYDMVLGGGMYVQTLQKLHRLDKLDKAEIPNYKNLNPNSLSKPYDPNNQYSAPYLGTVMAIAYNKKTVPIKITSYQDLLNPALKNQLVTVDDSRAVVGTALMATGHGINDTSNGALKDASNYLAKLKPNIQVFDGNSPKTYLINGQVSAGLIYGGEIALAMQNNPDIQVVYPNQDTYFSYDVFMKLKNAPNADNVEKFINYMLEPKVSAQFTEAFPYSDPNQEGVKLLPESFKDNPAITVPDNVIQHSQNVLDLGKDTSKVDQVWNNFKGND